MLVPRRVHLGKKKYITHNILKDDERGGRDQPHGRPTLGVTAELRSLRGRGQWDRAGQGAERKGELCRATMSFYFMSYPELIGFT